jgi:hypothetical protein
MKKLFAGLIMVMALTACGSNANSGRLANCYHGHVGDSDSVFTIEKQSGSSISGKMAFIFAQKDSSHGTYEGTLKNGALKVKYLFWSEGVQSVGDYVFTQNGRNFIGSGYTYLPAQDCQKYLQK